MNSTLVWLTAFSGLTGALLTQLMSGLFSYINDSRKRKIEEKNIWRAKRVEIGESFYFMSGELMAMIKKNVAYWKNKLEYRSDASREFLKREMGRLDAYQVKLQTENWKYNLVGIYFQVPYSFVEMLEDNKVSHELYLKMLDLPEIIDRTLPQERDDLLQQYEINLSCLCDHYEQICRRMENNVREVAAQLKADFH